MAYLEHGSERGKAVYVHVHVNDHVNDHDHVNVNDHVNDYEMRPRGRIWGTLVIEVVPKLATDS